MHTSRKWISIIVGLALVVLVPVHGEAQTWTKSSPGAGGAFTCVDVSANGTVLVGSDLSGLYKRESSTAGWTRIGHSDGIKATAVDAAKWKPGSNTVALAGTRNGLYRTANGGASWSVVANPWDADDDVSAIGWSATNSTVYVATIHAMSSANCPAQGSCTGDQADSLKIVWLWKSTNDGVGFSAISNHGIPSGRRVVKILVDPNTTDGSKVYFLSGADQGLANASKELYLSTASGSSSSLVSGATYAIDVAVDSIRAGRVLMTSSNLGPGLDDAAGKVWMSTNSGSAWTQLTMPSADVTGAIWFNGGNAYVINVQRNACVTPPAVSGKFKLSSSDSWVLPTNVTTAKEDNGLGGLSGLPNTATWDLGWTDCAAARGRAFNSVAFTLSARGEYWVTSQFVWRHNTSGAHKYENAFTTISGSTYQTKGIDNANPWVIAMGNSQSTIYAGYHDLGMWKSTDHGSTWTNKNVYSALWDIYGGNVSSILVSGADVSGADTVFAAMAENDDPAVQGEYKYGFNMHRTTDGGATWSIHNGGLLKGFFYSLHKNGTTGRMWVTRDGAAYYSDNKGVSWTAATGAIPTNGIFIVTTINDVVLAGGWAGLWRATNHGTTGSTWTEVTSGNDFDFSDTGDDSGDLLKLNRVSWHGIHQILVDENVWVVSYVKHNYSGSTNRGIWRSTDLGASFTSLTWQTGVTDTAVRRGIAVDSCSRRIHITSGTPHTSGINNSTALDRASGKLTCPLDAAGNFVYSTCKVEATGPDYRYRFGGAIVANGNSDYVYVSVPGHGLMRQTLATGGATPCETEFRGGGGDMSARRLREEGPAPAIEPSVFTLKEAYDRELYDLSGRKVKVTKPGVYFERRVLPGGVTRRTVVVTP